LYLGPTVVAAIVPVELHSAKYVTVISLVEASKLQAGSSTVSTPAFIALVTIKLTGLVCGNGHWNTSG
jgi:hypothetical protein